MHGKFLGTVAAGVTAVGIAAAANAGQITQTVPIGSQTLEILGAAGQGTFQYFRTACGGCSDVLTSVQLRIQTSETITALTVTNTSVNPQNMQYISFSDVTATGTAPGPDLSWLTFNIFSNGNPGSGDILLIDTGVLSYTAGETKTFSPPPLVGSVDSLLVNSLTPGSYDTTGTFTLGFSTNTFQGFSGAGGNGSQSQSTIGDGTITVIYNYTSEQLPEPTTLAVLGLGLAGLGFARRRRS